MPLPQQDTGKRYLMICYQGESELYQRAIYVDWLRSVSLMDSAARDEFYRQCQTLTVGQRLSLQRDGVVISEHLVMEQCSNF